MRILHLSTRLILGGSQENTVLSCEGQTRAGHDVHLAFGSIYGPEGSLLDRVKAFRTDDGRGITTRVLPDMVRELSPWHDHFSFRQCRRLINELDPDIVHTHSSKAGVLGRWAGWKEGGAAGRRGVVHTIHGLPFHPYQSSWRHWVYVQSERFAAKRCHAIVTVCNAMRTQALAAGVGTPDLFTTVYSGMETEQFLNPGVTRAQARQRLGIAPDDFIIGTVARLAELKGHDDLLDAIGSTMRDRPQWKMLWVGDGWWRERLLGRVRDLGLEARVIAPGLVLPGEVPALMGAMDVLVHPSYREGLPRTVPQALLSGVPVVAYDVDGAPEVCIEGQTGRLVAPGNRDALREAIAWMADHPDQRSALAERGRALCRERFSVQRMIDDLQTLYERVLNRLPGRASR